MDPIDIFFRAVGAFYVFAGYAGCRAMIAAGLIDRLLVAMASADELPKERFRRAFLGTATVTTGASGAALMLMSFWALPLFLIDTVMQFGWLAWSRSAFPPEDEDEQQGRLQTANAAVLYGIATFGVIWLWFDGRLGPWDDAVAIAAIAATAAILGGWMLRDAYRQPGRGADAPFDDCQDLAAPPVRVVIDPEFARLPLVDGDTGRRVSHRGWLPDDLAARIEEWDDAYQAAFDPDDWQAPASFTSAEDEAAYIAEAQAIARGLERAIGKGKVRFGEGWPDGALRRQGMG